MKIRFIILILLFSLILYSITIINGEKTFDLNLAELHSKPQLELDTHRNKDGKVIDDKWIGADFKAILAEFEITEFDQLKFQSADNYLVRITREDLLNSKAIIALNRNGKELNEEKIRLLMPAIRDMFWIQGINLIMVEKFKKMPDPTTLFIAESLITDIALLDDPKPFTKVQGYLFRELAEIIFPIKDGDFLLIGSDGVKHNLTYDKYLKNAVLVLREGKLDLQSPDMPAGMWIKNLAYVQNFNRALIFKAQFESFNNVADLAEWTEKPEILKVVDPDRNNMNTSIHFADEKWQKIKKLKW